MKFRDWKNGQVRDGTERRFARARRAARRKFTFRAICLLDVLLGLWLMLWPILHPEWTWAMATLSMGGGLVGVITGMVMYLSYYQD